MKEQQKIISLMQINCFPKQKWKVIDKKKDLDLAMWYEGGVLYVNFKGSDSFIDWIYNFSFLPIKAPYKNMVDKYYTHSGFSKLYHVARDDIHNEFKKHKDIRKIVIVGHSLGGALATLCYADFMWHKKYKGYDVRIDGLASGCPRVGFLLGYKNFNEYTKGLIRLKFNSDIVTSAPFSIFGYKHIGEYIHFGKRSWWPFSPSRIFHHWSESYLNHLKNKDFKDNADNNYLFKSSIIIMSIINLILFAGLFSWLIRSI